MSLSEVIATYTGIQNALILDFVTGLIFVFGILLIVAIFVKFLFHLL